MAPLTLQREAEERLIEAIREGKQEAFGLLYDAYAPVLLGLISRIVQNTEVAEEVLKETFLAIWSRIHIFDPTQSRFLTWGLAMARGIALEAHKTGKYAHLTFGKKDEDPVTPEATRETDQLEESQTKEVFCQLQPQENAILDLIYHKGYTCQQAAEALNISQEELKSQLKSAFKHIGAERTA
ncbi:RNA polymerase sigma factor [Sabulibacter ruber]|uniref:RNA polymerase sigma factor n=1 Tax=Sabulibacter ruber TaxID=2811901 RepID=UPI001A96CD63|nr:sigma-70 family RNA polymerase sigma factor [Sabulibacter ruber]